MVEEASYYLSTTVDLSYEEAVAKVKEALKEEGFGVLTEIDVKATLKEKLNLDVPPYVILGACNPPFAHQALEAEPHVGVLLPCNVTVRQMSEGKVEVAAMNPEGALGVIQNARLQSIGMEVKKKLKKVLENI